MKRLFGETPDAWGFVLPSVVIILGLSIVPMIWSLILSMQSSDLVTPARWIGLTNYRVLAHDPGSRRPAGPTLVSPALFVPLSLGGGGGVAVMLNRRIRFIGIYRTMVFVPFVISA